MRFLIIALFILLLFSFGCLDLYHDVISNNCDDAVKYNSSYEQIDCLTEQSRYLAAFNEEGRALDTCEKIKTKFIGKDSGSTINIFPSSSVASYNGCVEEVAVFSLDESVCQKQLVPNVFSAISNAFSSLPVIGSTIGQTHYKGCVDKVIFRKSQLDSLKTLTNDFIKLMTTDPGIK